MTTRQRDDEINVPLPVSGFSFSNTSLFSINFRPFLFHINLFTTKNNLRPRNYYLDLAQVS